MFELTDTYDDFDTKLILDSEWVHGFCEECPEKWVSTEPLPKGHFGTYFGAEEVRTYKKVEINDLYKLHELAHKKRTYTYDPTRIPKDWAEAMYQSEIESSLISECYAYIRIPGLRAKTFDHDIWVDRFIKDIDLKELNRHPEEVAKLEAHIKQERLRAICAPKRWDFHELQIANYAAQNWAWYEIFLRPCGLAEYGDRPAFHVIEEHMASANRDDTHRAWLKSVTGWHTPTHTAVPFAPQAEAFTPLYEESARKFGNNWFTPVTF